MTPRRGHHREFSVIAIIFLLISLFPVVVAAQPALVSDSKDLVINGDLSQGAGTTPTGWKSDSWLTGPGISSFEWHRTANGGELSIVNHQPNDARWVQHLNLLRGWYHFTAQVRAAGVGGDHLGASISLIQGWVSSADLKGNQDWRPVDFYLHIGDSGADVELACRLGGFSNDNTGEAECRNIHGYPSSAPSSSSAHVFELDKGPLSRAPAGPGTLRMLLLAGGIVLMLVLIGWRYRRVNIRLRAAPNAPCEPLAVRSSGRGEIEIALFILALLSFAYFYQASDHSVACRIDLIRSILERHALWIDGYAGYNTADILRFNGHIFPAKAPGTSFAAIPSWLIARALLAPLTSFLREGTYWALVTYLTTLLSLSLIVALMTVLMYSFASLLGIDEGRAVVVALILAFGTVMFPYATEFTGEPMAAACAFAAFYLLALPTDTASTWRSVGAGFLAGWSVLCDFTTVFLAGAIAAYAIRRLRRVKPIAAFGLGALAVVLILLVHNQLAFGKPFFVSYEGLALAGTQFPEHQVGFLGVTSFNQAVLWKVLFLLQRGLFFCNPVLLLAFPGLLFWWWRGGQFRAELAVATFAILSFIALNGSFVDAIRIWGGGTSVGPRHLIPIVPFLVLAIAFLPAAFDFPLALLALISAGFMLMATSVDPHLPYEYDQPLRDFLWPAYLRGDLGLNRDAYYGGLPVVGDSVAFNLGKLVGLPGALQLLPLLAFWLAMGWRLVHQLRPPVWASRPLPRLAVSAALIVMFAPPTLGAFVRPDLDQASGLLGRYYEGLYPEKFPPHIVRVDTKIDFNSITDLGSLPSPFCVLWSGQIYAPKNGLYQFDLQTADTDDVVWLTVDGHPVIADPGSRTQVKRDGDASLTAGWHRIELGDRHLWGGTGLHFLWQPPGMASELVPTSNLKPTPVFTVLRRLSLY